MSCFRNLSLSVGLHKLVQAILSATQFAFRMNPVALLGNSQRLPSFALDAGIILANFFKNAGVSSESIGSAPRLSGERFFIRLRSMPSIVFAIPSARSRQSQPATSKSSQGKPLKA